MGLGLQIALGYSIFHLGHTLQQLLLIEEISYNLGQVVMKSYWNSVKNFINSCLAQTGRIFSSSHNLENDTLLKNFSRLSQRQSLYYWKCFATIFPVFQVLSRKPSCNYRLSLLLHIRKYHFYNNFSLAFI